MTLTNAPSSAQRKQADFSTLDAALDGDILLPGENAYNEDRLVWNGMIDRYPAAIAMCLSTSDVSASIRFATGRGIPISVRGCGHNIAGTAVTPDGLMINLARMNQVEVDPDANRVRVGPGASWSDVDSATEPFGLVVPGGIVSTTGVAGFTLGGGFGWLTRKWGYTSDLLVSATIVTADGNVREISNSSEPDLFWAIGGGGGNFGIVTTFEFEAKPLGPEVTAGLVLWPISEASAVIDLYRQVTVTAPVDLTCVLVLRVAPSEASIPTELQGKPVVGIAAMHSGAVEDGMSALQSLKSFGSPILDTIQPKPYREHQAMLDAGQPYGRRYYWKSVYLDAISAGVEEALLNHATTFVSPFSSVLLPHLDSSQSGLEHQSSAVSFRRAKYLVNYQSAWIDPEEDTLQIDWARQCFNATQPFAVGRYVNFLTEDEVSNDNAEAYDEPTMASLAMIKRRVDPDNLFNLNKNIRPASD